MSSSAKIEGTVTARPSAYQTTPAAAATTATTTAHGGEGSWPAGSVELRGTSAERPNRTPRVTRKRVGVTCVNTCLTAAAIGDASVAATATATAHAATT